MFIVRTWIKEPLAILSSEASGGIVVEDGIIAECLSVGASPAAPCEETFDASRCVLLPGLVNTHHHFYQTLTRAYGPALDKELFDWLKTLYPVWARLTPEYLHVATRLALAELLLSGCTTAADHHYVFPDGLDEVVDVQVDAARTMGVRVTLTRGSMNLSVEEGGLPPVSVVQDADTILADSARVIDAFHDPSPGAMVQIALAPCSPFSVTREIMIDTALLAAQRNIRLHTHLSETEDENAFCQEMFACRPLDYLEEVGWLTDRVWLAHGIHFDHSEIARLGAAGTGIAHCPGSNMLLASGMCPAIDLEASGVPVGIGVDGSASEDASNLMQEVRQALQIQRLRYGAAKVSHGDVLRWATSGSAICLGRDDIGRIEVGKQADLSFFRLDEPRFSGAGDPLAALVLCGAHRADRVMVGGDWRVIDEKIVDFDLESLLDEHRAAALALTA
ncbi:MAG: 8-oxoguanine deaminase [Pseudomonadota bacterium]|nr:8-oxoguanine deaminase [Pseudomonadota bacterium]